MSSQAAFPSVLTWGRGRRCNSFEHAGCFTLASSEVIEICVSIFSPFKTARVFYLLCFIFGFLFEKNLVGL